MSVLGVKPGKALERVGFAACAEHLPMDFAVDAVRVMDVADVTRCRGNRSKQICS